MQIRFFFLLFLSLLATSYAAESIWYSDKDLKEDNIKLIPEGYIDLSVIDACSVKTYDKPLSLVDVTEAALCYNPQTKEVYASAKAQAAQVGVARSLFFPSVTDTVSTSENKTQTSNYSSNLKNTIVASYLLYDFGSRDATLENANQLLKAASATQSATVQNVLLSAVNAFYQVHASKAILNASIETEHLYQESFKSAEAKYIAGVATPADKLQAQTSFANATLIKIKNEGILKIAYGNLASIMGVPASMPLEIADAKLDTIPEMIDQDIEALIEKARLQRPDLIASEAQLKASLAKIEAAKADSKPTLSVNLSNIYADDSKAALTNTSSIGINVSIPLFGGYKPTYLIRSAEATAELNASKRDQLKLQVSLDVWTAYQNLKTANESITASNILV